MTSQMLAPLAVFAATVLAAAWARKRPAWLRLAIVVTGLALLTAALLPVVGSTLAPNFGPLSASEGVPLARLLLAAWWMLLARALILAGQIALGVDRQQHVARLASDLAAATVYLGTGLAILDLVFGVSVTGLVATSGIIAIVLGLALQNTLGDLFSGIAMGIDRPFNVGDVVWIEGGVEGRVVEVNWRSTRIATATNDLATVPNSVVAKSRLLNRSSPSERHTGSIRIALEPGVLPRDAIVLLREAAAGTDHLSPGAEPSVVCTELRGEAALYEITLSAPLGSFDAARSDFLHQVARHSRHAGVALAPQDGSALVRLAAPQLHDRLREVLLLHALDEAELDELATLTVQHRGEPGATLFEQGGGLASMFIIARGTFAVMRDDGHGLQRLGTIGPGDYFGELALLTGTPNAATVRALTSFEALEVTKTALTPLMQKNPRLLHAFEEAAAKAQALLTRTIAAQAARDELPTLSLLVRIRTFFGL